jgi:hypothetical protein
VPSRLTPAVTSAEEVALAVDRERAHALLHEIAVDLRLLGLRGRAAHLHVRALDLKRDVARWTVTTVRDSQREATVEDLLALHEETKAEREKRR